MRRVILATLALAAMSAPAVAAAPKVAPAPKPDACAYTEKAPTAVRWFCVLNNPAYDPIDPRPVGEISESDPTDPYESCMQGFYALAKTRIGVAQVVEVADKACAGEMLAVVKSDGPRFLESRRVDWIQTYIRAGAAPSEAFPRVPMQGD